jgi:hypothetical protein
MPLTIRVSDRAVSGYTISRQRDTCTCARIKKIFEFLRRRTMSVHSGAGVPDILDIAHGVLLDTPLFIQETKVFLSQLFYLSPLAADRFFNYLVGILRLFYLPLP